MGVKDKLYEAAGTISDYVYGTKSPSSATEQQQSSSSNNTYWAYASSSFQSALDSTSAAANSLYASMYSPTNQVPPTDTTTTTSNEPPHHTPKPYNNNNNNNNMFVGWKLQNPYSNIRSHQNQPSSLSAVRSLLQVVPAKSFVPVESSSSLHPLETFSSLDHSISSLETTLPSSSKSPVISKNETASQLAEGTIRALRDLELEEAMELHSALAYWTHRWERPLLSWLEAGPWVWFSSQKYNHNKIGQCVSQIQAVLARRCAAIGELQQHLLRAGWQKGVAQWGVLGQGGEWANVAGADGAIPTESTNNNNNTKLVENRRRFSSQSMDLLPEPEQYQPDSHQLPQDPNAKLYYGHCSINVRKTIGGSVVMDDSALAAWSVDAIWLVRDQLYRASIGLVELPFAENWRGRGGELIAEGNEAIVTCQLPVWAAQRKTMTETKSVDMEIDTILEHGEEHGVDAEGGEEQILEQTPLDDNIAQTDEKAVEGKEDEKIVITDLNAMASEVSELLNSMEVVIEMQRDRRLEKLKGLPLIRRNWYVAAIGAPLTTYFIYRLLKNGQAANLVRFAMDKIRSFFNEHVYSPVSAILSELFTRRDRDTIIDHKARLDAIESLKKMIKSWLEETYGDVFTKEEIQSRAQIMDMSLIEQKKEEHMKTIFEINSVVRMSLIEMQFIKKELLNALYAIDDMMLSNEINMNLATVTPAVLLVFLVNKTFRFMFYALLKVGKSREETYASFRHVLLDMDRLLLMRDNPPSAPPPLTWTESGAPAAVPLSAPVEPLAPRVLNADDLGMLMLHIHECRTILWEDRRRFSLQTLRDVAEDLAELAGERGPVSVEQQLQIISRMCRTYPFLKVHGSSVG